MADMHLGAGAPLTIHSFGARLRALRLLRGLTQAQVVERGGPANVSLLELGAEAAQVSTVQAYLDAIGASWEDLVMAPSSAPAEPLLGADQYDYDLIGAALRGLRLDGLDLTQSDLAAAAGVSRRAMINIEAGSVPSFDVLRKILDASPAHDLIWLARQLWTGATETFRARCEAVIRRGVTPTVLRARRGE